MLSIRRHLLPAALALAITPAAFAQDAWTTGDAGAAGKRVSIVGGYAMTEPTRNPQIAGTRTQFEGEGAPTLGVTWHINENIGIEAWGSDAIGHRVSSGGQKIASVDAQPVAVSGQYHFGAADNVVRPFVGLGYHQTNFKDETAQAGGALAGQRIGVEDSKGAVGTVGVDVSINETWFARADARYFDGKADVRLDGETVGQARLNPVMVGVGVGARF